MNIAITGGSGFSLAAVGLVTRFAPDKAALAFLTLAFRGIFLTLLALLRFNLVLGGGSASAIEEISSKLALKDIENNRMITPSNKL